MQPDQHVFRGDAGEKNVGTLDSIPARMSVVKTVRGVELTYKKSRIMGFAVLGFSLLWSTLVYCCVYFMLSKEGGPDWSGAKFMIPFILVGIVGISIALYVLFGRMVLTLNLGSGELFRGIGDIGRRQPFRLERDAPISIRETNVWVNGRLLYKIVVDQPQGKPFQFGTCLAEDDARRYVVALLERMRG